MDDRDTAPTRPPCGCALAPDPASGVLRKLAWCRRHAAERRDPAGLGEAYYRELGALDADAPARYVAELEEALGPLPKATAPADALEVGCGASPYVAAIRAAGYAYFGLDPSPWVRPCMARRWGAWCDPLRLEDVRAFYSYGLILCAHAFEHMDDAPGAIRRCAGLLAPSGELWVIVPDDSDLCNPDHVWFMNEPTLRSCLEAAGLEVVTLAVRRRVEHESFLYARARKP
jgi:SAM-dependent methyltransferase